MVYGGKPSTGCQNCRKRRIKCDETRPHCKACVRTGRSCPGYPHPLDVMLRNQVAFQRKKKGSSSKSPTPQLEIEAAQPLPPTPASTVAFFGETPSATTPWSASLVRAVQPSVPCSLFPPLEETVTSMFFNSYVYTPRDPLIWDGFMDILPQVFSSAQPGSHIYAGTCAVSFFSVAAWTGNRSFLETSERLFVQTMSKTRQALQGDVSQNVDEILMAILLLSTYEEFCALKENRHTSRTHLRGAVALVNTRPPDQQASVMSPILQNALHGYLLKSSKRLACPTMQTPHMVPVSPIAPQSAASQLAAATAELVSLRQTWDEVNLATTPHDITDIENLLTRALCLDTNLVAWTHALPEHWKPLPATIIPPSIRQAGMYQNRCDCYTDMWVAGTWNFYRDSRLTIQNIILHCLRLLPGIPDEQIQSTLDLMHSLALGICATVPYILGSQTTSVHMSPQKVEYPEADGRRVSPSHHQTATLIGGWLVSSHLTNLQTLNISAGINDWVVEQKRRVLGIYTFGAGCEA